jgi:hypothetical protein
MPLKRLKILKVREDKAHPSIRLRRKFATAPALLFNHSLQLNLKKRLKAFSMVK